MFERIVKDSDNFLEMPYQEIVEDTVVGIVGDAHGEISQRGIDHGKTLICNIWLND